MDRAMWLWLAKAGLESDVAEGELPACDQIGCVFDAASNDVLMDRQAQRLLENHFEVRRAHVDELCEFRERQVLAARWSRM